MARPSPGHQRYVVAVTHRGLRGAISPERYGPWKTAHERLRRWTADGIWDKILEEVIVKDDAVGEVIWEFSVDASSVRAHQHAAGARTKGDAGPDGSKTSPSTATELDDPAAG